MAGTCRPNQPALAEQHAAAVAKVCRLIESAEEAPDLDALAGAAGMSRFHFSRAFTAQFGTPPHQYLRRVRLDESARLLRSGHSVTDAALGAGISDLARFAQLFRARFGVAPRVYADGRGARQSASVTASTSSTSMRPSALRS